MQLQGDVYKRTDRSQIFQKIRHAYSQTSSYDLKSDQPNFALSTLDIRDVPPAKVKVYGHVCLSPAFGYSELADTSPHGFQKCMIPAGHFPMVVLF